jgi:C-terminal processing protease CtpA/Prc
VNRKTIDWASFDAAVLNAAQGATSISGTYPAIQVALGMLGDHHSFYLKPDGSLLMNPTAPHCVDVTPVVPTLPATVGYLKVPAVSGTFQAQQLYAENLQDSIRQQDSGGIQGWIVDLRGNLGGSSWAMISGVGPILGEGLNGYFVGPDGSNPWEYLAGRAYLGGTVIFVVNDPYNLQGPPPMVAVLIDQVTVSAGEAAAIAFEGRPNTRVFGNATCGLSTGNGSYTLSDGATLVLTGSTDADRTGRVYGGSVVPDETITDPIAVVQRAVNWITGR